MRSARLVTIPFSHYCEKARWALERCGVAFREDGHLPMFHYLAATRARGGRTVPILVTEDGEVLRDSTAIVAWADARRPGALIPPPGAERDAALALEDDLDLQLGPSTRRWAYGQILPRKDLRQLMSGHVPRWQLAAFRVAGPLVAGALRRGLKITPEGVARSHAKIEAAFARIEALLADGRRYLTGDRFTVADLTFASLATPVLLPAQLRDVLPAPETFEGEGGAQIAAWRASKAGAFALRLYAEERATVS